MQRSFLKFFAPQLLRKKVFKFMLASMKTQVAASEFPILAAPQRELETSIQPLKRPTANHLSVILKSYAETRFKNF
jgi:hypothetical protein